MWGQGPAFPAQPASAAAAATPAPAVATAMGPALGGRPINTGLQPPTVQRPPQQQTVVEPRVLLVTQQAATPAPKTSAAPVAPPAASTAKPSESKNPFVRIEDLRSFDEWAGHFRERAREAGTPMPEPAGFIAMIGTDAPQLHSPARGLHNKAADPWGNGANQSSHTGSANAAGKNAYAAQTTTTNINHPHLHGHPPPVANSFYPAKASAPPRAPPVSSVPAATAPAKSALPSMAERIRMAAEKKAGVPQENVAPNRATAPAGADAAASSTAEGGLDWCKICYRQFRAALYV